MILDDTHKVGDAGKSISMRIHKIDETEKDFHLVYGVVYTPLSVDSHGETMTIAEVEKMAHDFLWHTRNEAVDVMHDNEKCGARVVESFITRAGDPDFLDPGSWVVGIKLPSGPLWDKIESGEYSGFSLQAVARKVPRKVTVDRVTAATGTTESNATDDITEHDHTFFVEFDEDGRVLVGMTSEEYDHEHQIRATVSTEMAEDHSHRYFIE